MQWHKKYLFTGLFFLGSLVFGFSQSIDSAIARYANEYGQERVYIQYDKSSYAPGETIWFKSYLMKGILPADESKTFYTDFSDDKGNLLSHNVSAILDGSSSGQFDIPADYTGKFIHVKAYTKWMLNFDSAFLYQKDILILGKSQGTAAPKMIVEPTLVFFPEGGDAVIGVMNKIAFKSNDQWGRPVKIKGAIYDKAGKIVDSIRILHDGMGFFYLNPQPGETYTAKWKDESGKSYITPLPAAKTDGISIQLNVNDTKRIFTVSAPPSAADGLQSIYLIGTINQFQAFKVKKDISNGIASGIIPVQNLPSGILTITVFDTAWNPLAERITYIKNEEYKFDAELTVEHWGLNKRARNEIMITVPDSLHTDFGVSITDAGIDSDSSNNIISGLMLTSDIKGIVFNPAYYFSENNNAINQNLDLVMLTNGWRRFKWDDVVKNKMPVIKFKKDTSYLSLSGKVYGATASQLRDNASIILVVNQKNEKGNALFYYPINPDGTFNDPSVILFDSLRVYYKLSKNIGDATVNFMESLLKAIPGRQPARGFYFNQLSDTTGHSWHIQMSDEMNRLYQQYEGKTLENVVIKAKTKTTLEVMDEKYASGLFGGGDGYQFDLLNDKMSFTARSIFEYLQAKVAGLQINTTTNPPSLTWRGGSPELFLNETPIDADFMATLPISDIAYVKVFRPPFFSPYGNGSSGGIAVYTRRGDDVKAEPGKGLNNNMVSGYSAVREFYSPNYSSFNATNEKRDLRTTLYWNPSVRTTMQKNKVKLVFYNNDVSKSFRVKIEGMTSDGRLVHIEQIME
jgi:hypothetical protein